MAYFNIKSVNENYVFPVVRDGSLCIVNNHSTFSKVEYSCEDVAFVHVVHTSGAYNFLYGTNEHGGIEELWLHDLSPELQEKILDVWNKLEEAKAEK